MKISEEARKAAESICGDIFGDFTPETVVAEVIQAVLNNASKPLVDALEAIGSDSQVEIGVPTTAGRLAAQLVACNSTAAKALATFRAEHGGGE
jgi:hypothetical protein